MPEYFFNKPGLIKVFVLDIQLKDICPFYNYSSYTDPELLIDTLEELSPEQLAIVQAHIDAYVDPDVYLELAITSSNTAPSKQTSSNQLTSVLVWILLGTDQTSHMGVFNALKSVLSMETDDITQFVGNTSATVSIELFSITRNVVLVSDTINITDALTSWETKANNNETGKGLFYKAIMYEGLRNHTCNYDNICELKLSVSHPGVKVNLNGLQMMYYHLL